MSNVNTQRKPSAKIEPVFKSIRVNVSADRAFELFTKSVEKWWPLGSHSLSMSVCGKPAATCAFEPFVGGRLFETMANGEDKEWGKILVWEEGKRIVFTWHVAVREDQATEVEVRFEGDDDAHTLVSLEHRNWEAVGEEGAAHREGYESGWGEVFEVPFAKLVEAESGA